MMKVRATLTSLLIIISASSMNYYVDAQTTTITTHPSDAESARFLEQATFGATPIHRQLQHEDHHFHESACNIDVDAAPCTGITAWLASQTDPAVAEVHIPCGECISMDVTDGSLFNFPNGLNIVGKLHIPEDASFTLTTKFVLVQGIMRMDPPVDGMKTLPRSDEAVVKIVLEGTEEVTFLPDNATDNAMACMNMTDMSPLPCTIGIKPFAVAGGRLDINAIDDNCPSWTKLQSLSADRKVIQLADPRAAECWAAGAELLFTSDGMGDSANMPDMHIATMAMASANLFDHTHNITLTVPLPRRLTSVEDSEAEGYGDMYGVEVALLTRRFTLEPKDNNNLIGGHTIIFHTPHVAQNIKGVEFRRFGQQGNIGRYPLHFHMSESVYGSVVSKNLVRDSNQRCYVIHGTHNVTLSENVAFDTFGHCFLTEDGGEWDNWFIRNLGTQTKRPATMISINGVQESDDEPTTFWISTPVNHYIGNVAAGSHKFGFWLERMTPVREPSASLTINAGVNPQTLPLGTFDGNVAHGCGDNGFAFYPKAYRPSTPAIVKNSYSFKNQGIGFRIGGTVDITLDGGVLSDNGKGGVESSGVLSGRMVSVTNLTIIGVSRHLDSLINETRPCSIEGVTYAAGKRENFTIYVTNIDFSGFTSTANCAQKAIVLSTAAPSNGDSRTSPLAYNNPFFENLSFDSATDRFSVCDAASVGVRGFAIDDTSGQLSSDGVGGFLLHDVTTVQGGLDYPSLTAFLPENTCSPVEGSCLLSCPGTCFRLVKIAVPSSPIHASKQMIVTDINNSSVKQLLVSPRTVFPNKEVCQSTDCRAEFQVWLPSTFGSYEISFVEADGTTVAWPGFVSPVTLGGAPTCPNYLTEEDIKIVYPAPNGRCHNPIYNGDLERGDVLGFQGECENTDFDFRGRAILTNCTPIAIHSLGAAGTSNALKTTDIGRNSNLGIHQFIDVSCLRSWASGGFSVRFSGYFRVLDANNADVACLESDSCAPTVTLSTSSALLLSTNIATSNSGWSFFETSISLPPNVTDADQAFLVVKGSVNHYIFIDELRLYVESDSPSSAPSASGLPSKSPTDAPSRTPSRSPSKSPTYSPSGSPLTSPPSSSPTLPGTCSNNGLRCSPANMGQCNCPTRRNLLDELDDTRQIKVKHGGALRGSELRDLGDVRMLAKPVCGDGTCRKTCAECSGDACGADICPECDATCGVTPPPMNQPTLSPSKQPSKSPTDCYCIMPTDGPTSSPPNLAPTTPAPTTPAPNTPAPTPGQCEGAGQSCSKDTVNCCKGCSSGKKSDRVCL